MIYRFRILLDNATEEAIFRDIEIRNTDTLEDLHNTITQSFGFDGSEMASFYVSDVEWKQGEEISLFDMSEGANEVKLMSETTLEDIVTEEQPHLIYVYDFLSMWTFYVDVIEISKEVRADLPKILLSVGEIPNEVPEKEFKADSFGDNEDTDDEYGHFDDDFDFNEY